jgi:hypothetical protein
MKGQNLQRYEENNKIVEKMESPEGHTITINNQTVTLRKGVDHPELGPKYLSQAPYKFGGKKRQNSNSGGQGRAARRIKRTGK